MRLYTVHIRAGRPPALIREGFSWGALILGPVWFLAHRAWIPALLLLAAAVAIWVLSPAGLAVPLLLLLAVLTGFSGLDLLRWSLSLHGFALVQVIAARDEDSAIARLIAARPDLRERLA